MILKAEAALERSRRNALIEGVMVRPFGFAARYDEQVLLGRHGKILSGEPGYRERDAIGVLARARNVVRRVVVLIFCVWAVVDEVEQVIEADRRPPRGSEVVVPHSHILQ